VSYQQVKYLGVNMKFTQPTNEEPVVYNLPNTDAVVGVLARIAAGVEGDSVTMVVNNVLTDTITVEGVTLAEGEAKVLFDFCQEFRKLNENVQWNVMNLTYTKAVGDADAFVDITVAWDQAKYDETKKALEETPDTQAEPQPEAPAAPAAPESPAPETETPTEPAAEPAPAPEQPSLPATIDVPEPTNVYRAPHALKLFGADGQPVFACDVTWGMEGLYPAENVKVEDRAWWVHIDTVALFGKKYDINACIACDVPGGKIVEAQVKLYNETVEKLDEIVEAFIGKELLQYLTEAMKEVENAPELTAESIKEAIVDLKKIKITSVDGKYDAVIGLCLSFCPDCCIGIKLVDGKVDEIDKIEVIAC